MSGEKTNLKDMGQAFKSLVEKNFTKYRGVLIERLSGDNFRVLGITHETESAARSTVDTHLDSLINKNNNQNGNKEKS